MKRFTIFAILIIVLLSILQAGVLVFAQGDGEDEIALVPFVSPDYTISGLVPDGWLEVSPGTFARGSADTDLVALVQQDVPDVTSEDIATILLANLGLEALPEEVVSVETAAFAWSIYVMEIEVPNLGNVVVDLALAETETTAYFVILQTLDTEYEALHETVFLPAVDALEIVALTWGHDEPPVLTGEEEAMSLTPEVLAEIDHDTTAYTQGFLLYDGSLYESTGRRGESMLREVDPETGEVLRMVDVDAQYFAEGLERVEDRLIQLTWQSEVAFVYDLETFEQIDTFAYAGEGWGLCFDGEYLFMSDGSPIITARDPQTFEVIFRGEVTWDGEPVQNLNELECVGDTLYANVWQTDFILQIDKSNGVVVAAIDALGLLPQDVYDALGTQQVLNGIAYNPETETFLITGKQWPTMFEVRFVEAAGGDE